MSKFAVKRTTKFRHVFGTAFKKDKCYDGVNITKSPHESNMCAVNGVFLAVVLDVQGGGAFFVAPLTKVGRFDNNYPKIAGHTRPVMDVAWNPFNDYQIASGSEDCEIKVWDIPEGGLKENLTESTATLKGHCKKVGQVLWHPTAQGILASSSYDLHIIIWNTETEESLFSYSHNEVISCMSWDYNGSRLAFTAKDKTVNILDPRSSTILGSTKCHDGNKISRCVFCGPTNFLITTGFSRSNDRQLGLWDADNLASCVSLENIDNGSGIVFPFWDEGTQVLYTQGKGDSTIKYFELAENKLHFLNMHQSNTPGRGLGAMPKRHLDYMKCEVMRFYKLYNGKSFVEPVSMTVPRKSDMFQEDVFPPCPSGEPSLTAAEWAAGENKNPKLVAFSATGLTAVSGGGGGQKAKPAQQVKTSSVPNREVTSKKEVTLSSTQADSAPVVTSTSSRGRGSRETTPTDVSGRTEPKTLEEYRRAYRELEEENRMLRAKLEGK